MKRGPGMQAKNANRGPLRKIVRVLRYSQNIFDPNWVELECGHEGTLKQGDETEFGKKGSVS